MESIQKHQPIHPLLQQIVQCITFWRRSPDHTQARLFLPNNICGFGLTLSGDFYVKRQGSFQKMPVFGTRNLLDQAGEIKTSGNFLNIAVRLTIPNGLGLFSKIPMNEVYSTPSFSLDTIFRKQEIDDLTHKLLEAPNDELKQHVLEHFLASKVTQTYPPVLGAIVQRIHQAGGMITVAELTREFLISERTLNRYFNTHIGINPIIYTNLIRFRSIINLSPLSHESLLDSALNLGYYDQSHFIKQFKRFSNLTPGEFLRMNGSAGLSDFYNTK